MTNVTHLAPDDQSDIQEPAEPDLFHENPIERQGFTQIPNAFLRGSYPGVDVGARYTYLLLKYFSWQDGEAFPSRQTLAELQGCSVDTINRNIRKLEAADLISQTRRGLGRTNIYQIRDLAFVRGTPTQKPQIPSSGLGTGAQSGAEVAPMPSPEAAPVRLLEVAPAPCKEDSDEEDEERRRPSKKPMAQNPELQGGMDHEPDPPLPRVRVKPEAITLRVMEVLGENQDDPALVARYTRTINGWVAKAKADAVPFHPVDSAQDCRAYFTTGKGKKRTVTSWAATLNNWYRNEIQGFATRPARSQAATTPKQEREREPGEWSPEVYEAWCKRADAARGVITLADIQQAAQ